MTDTPSMEELIAGAAVALDEAIAGIVRPGCGANDRMGRRAMMTPSRASTTAVTIEAAMQRLDRQPLSMTEREIVDVLRLVTDAVGELLNDHHTCRETDQ